MPLITQERIIIFQLCMYSMKVQKFLFYPLTGSTPKLGGWPLDLSLFIETTVGAVDSSSLVCGLL